MAAFGDNSTTIQPLSEEVKNAGLSVGVDVEKLRQKYLSAKLVSSLESQTDDSVKIKQQIEDAQRMRELEAGARGEPSENPKLPDVSSRRLDNIVICPRCAGQGLVKQSYNFQIRESNCEECEAEGILYKDEKGMLRKASEVPKADVRSTSSKVMTDKEAEEVSRTLALVDLQVLPSCNDEQGGP